MANVLMVIQPYWYQGSWVFDDEAVELDKEPFVQGIPEMIDEPVRDISNARSEFVLLFSAMPFSSYQAELTRVREEYRGYCYKVKNQSAEGWLCPALFRYFDPAPESLYVKAEPGRGRYEPTEIPALKERIEELEHLAGKLALENESLRNGRERWPRFWGQNQFFHVLKTRC